MTRLDADLSPQVLAAMAGTSVFVVLGLLSLAPVPVGGGFRFVAVLVLGTLLLAGMLVGSQQVLTHAKREVLASTAMEPDTGLATPFAAEQALEREFAAAQRGRPLTIALVRIDNFSQYASRHGVAVAKRLARDVGRVLARHRRAMHTAARYGSDVATFLSVMADVDAEGASVYAKKIRRSASAIPGAPEPAVVSVAIASYDLTMSTPAELLEQAERALTRVGEAGGKIIVVGQGVAT